MRTHARSHRHKQADSSPGGTQLQERLLSTIHSCFRNLHHFTDDENLRNSSNFTDDVNLGSKE
jgi:hypothetical protein